METFIYEASSHNFYVFVFFETQTVQFGVFELLCFKLVNPHNTPGAWPTDPKSTNDALMRCCKPCSNEIANFFLECQYIFHAGIRPAAGNVADLMSRCDFMDFLCSV